MRPSLRKKNLDDFWEADAILNRMIAGIALFEEKKGCRPAAMLLDYEMFWRTLHSEHITLNPGNIIELDGVRVIPSPCLDGQIFLVEHLYEVPDVIFLEES